MLTLFFNPRLELESELVRQGKELVEEMDRNKEEMERKLDNERKERKKEKEDMYNDFEQVNST